MTLLWECGRIRNCIRLLTGTMWVRYPPLLLLCRYSLTARTLGFHPRDRSSILRSDTFCEVDCWSSNLSHKQVYEGSIPSFATFLFFWLPNIDLDVIILMKESRRASMMFTRVNESFSFSKDCFKHKGEATTS